MICSGCRVTCFTDLCAFERSINRAIASALAALYCYEIARTYIYVFVREAKCNWHGYIIPGLSSNGLIPLGQSSSAASIVVVVELELNLTMIILFAIPNTDCTKIKSGSFKSNCIIYLG